VRSSAALAIEPATSPARSEIKPRRYFRSIDPPGATWLDGADIVEHGAKDLLKMFGAFLEVLGIGDVKDAMRLRNRQAFDQTGVCLFDGGERRIPYVEIKLDLPMAHRREVLASPFCFL
jgi:hypothetical protein